MKTKSKNQQRVEAGEEQVGRTIGTTRAKKPILKKEYERLLNATHKSITVRASTKVKLANAFTLLYLTGCRVSEIIDISKSDIEKMILTNEFSLSNDTKTNKPRLISFDSDGVQVDMLSKMQFLDNGYLFAKNNSDKVMTVSALKYMMNSFIHRVLGELYSTHSFRTGYITTAHQLGLSLKHIQQDIGHKSLSTTARYATVTNEEISHGKTLREW